MDKGLGKRIFEFAVDVIQYSRKLPRSKEYEIIKNQFIKSSTSAGANYEEAQGASSKPDFINKIKIALKEMRETNYWIRILQRIQNQDEELDRLSGESEELMKILGSISAKATDNKS